MTAPTVMAEPTTEPTPPVAAQEASAAMTETEATVVAEATEAPVAVERPAWQLLPITNAQTGESFTLADFAGKTVWVEPFATWCVNCRQQLNYVNQARANFGDEVVFIALSVEPNIGNEALVQYATEEGFDLIFAAMSPDLLREMVAVYGQTITNPPATPHFILRPDGSTTDLFTGIEGPEAVTRLIQSEQG
jgi:thiol-disulfide isomerase/thioredoxin